jgi:peptidoglycan/LPS O-acetylase OafA/YrhL
MPGGGSTHISYRPDIDGLRALAVLVVMLFHARVGPFTGGFVGVDVFFVISGFLIASIIEHDLVRAQFTFMRFYERRVRRIFPALFVLIVICFPLAAWLLMPPAFEAFSASVAAISVFSSNILFWKEAGYFASPSEIKPLLHTWSLAVEEQFYLIFPAFFVFITLRFKNWRLQLLITLAAASLLLSIWGVKFAPGATFYLMPTRIWELLLGAILAISILHFPKSRNPQSPKDRTFQEILSVSGLAMITWSAVAYTDGTPFPGLHALLPCGGCAFIVFSGARGSSYVGRILSLPPVIFLGKISYSLYLLHWPALVFYRYYVIRPLTQLEAIGVLVASVGLAILSWRFVELPCRRSSPRVSRGSVVSLALSGASILLIGGLAGYVTDGWHARFPDYVRVNYRDTLPEYRERTCFLLQGQRPGDWAQDECFVSKSGKPTALLWGDSFGAHLAPGFSNTSAAFDHDILQYTVAACPPVFNPGVAWREDCDAFSSNVRSIIETYKPSVVIISMDWLQQLKYRGNLIALVQSTIAALTQSGTPVVVIGQSPVFQIDNVYDVEYRLKYMHRVNEGLFEFLAVPADFNKQLRRELPSVRFIDPLVVLCTADYCPGTRNRELLYIDRGHLSVTGSVWLMQSIAPQFHIDPNSYSVR